MRLARVLHDGRERVVFFLAEGLVPLEEAARLHGAAEGSTLSRVLAAAASPGGLLECLPPNGPAHAEARRLADWLDSQPAAVREGVVAAGDVRLLRPIASPPKIFLLAGNYAAHIEEGGGVAVLRQETFPYVFMKPATALNDPGAPFALPAIPSRTIDWELELGVVIGRRAKGVPQASALEYVAGYTVVNDISDRGFHPNDKRRERPKDGFFDWLHGKWHDGSCPMGPCVRSADTVADPQKLAMRLTVNGETKQDSSTARQIFPVAAVIEFISSFVTLEPGDVISTGTPAGVGNTKKTYLNAGDRVESTIDGIGTLVTPIAAQ